MLSTKIFHLFSCNFLRIVILIGLINSAFGQVFTVTNTNDSGPGSLREAIEMANAGSVDSVLFSIGISERDTIFLSSPLIITTNSIKLLGNLVELDSQILSGITLRKDDSFLNTGSAIEINSDSVYIEKLIFNSFPRAILVDNSTHSVINKCIIENCEQSFLLGVNTSICTVENNLIGTYNQSEVNFSTSNGSVSINGFEHKLINNIFNQPGDITVFGQNITLEKNVISVSSSFINFTNRFSGLRIDYNSDCILKNNVIGGRLIKSLVDTVSWLNPAYIIDFENLHDNPFEFGIDIKGSGNLVGYSNSPNYLLSNNNGLLIDGVINGQENKLSSNFIYNNLNKAIILAQGGNNSKDTATFTSYDLTPTTLTFSGTSTPEDSVEIFINNGIPQNALEYIGTAKADVSGKWSIDLDRSKYFKEGQLNYYVTTATDLAGNTSELSNPYMVLPDKCVVTNTEIDGLGSFKSTLECVYYKPGFDTVYFDIPGQGEHVIKPLNTFALLDSDSLVIDGSTQAQGEIVFDGQNSVSYFMAISGKKGFGLIDVDLKNYDRGVVFGDCQNCFMDSCRITNVSKGIDVSQNNIGLALKNNYIKNSFDVAIYISGNPKKATLINNTIDSSGNFAIQLSASDSNVVHNNILNNGTGIGVQICCSRGNKVSNNSISGFQNGGAEFYGAALFNLAENNTIIDNEVFGFRLTNASQFDTIRNNVIGGTTGDNIRIENSSTFNVLDANYIGLNAAFDSLGATSDGIEIILGSYKNTITNNYLGFHTANGINNISDSTVVYNNFIGHDGTNAFPNHDNGIFLATPSRGLRVKENHIQENKQAGISVGTFGTAGNLISQNILIDNGIVGIEMNVSGNNSGNNNKKTPYITAINQNGSDYALTIETEPNDVLVEVFEGDSTRQNALSFLTDQVPALGNGVWEVTINRPQANPQFVITSTAADSSTSALGFYIEDCFTVYNTGDDGLGSLREAIECANMDPDTNTITFNIPGDGPHQIVLDSELPDITETVIIDGEQNGFKTTVIGNGGGNGIYFILNSDSSIVKSMSIKGFNYGVHTDQNVENLFINSVESSSNTRGIYTQAQNTYLTNCLVENNSFSGISCNGFNLFIDSTSIINNGGDGLIAEFNMRDLEITNSLISGNNGDGLNLVRINSSIIDHCKIGVDSTGRLKMPNQNHGISTSFSGPGIINNCIIGGNLGNGINDPDRVDLAIFGTYIGTNDYGDNLGNGGNGIFGQQSNLTIGSNHPDSLNVIGFNGEDGIFLNGTSSSVNGNYIGVFPNGDDIHNFHNGMVLTFGMFAANNYIGFNYENGVVSQSNNIIIKNHIGIGPNDENWGNLLYGIELLSGNDIITNRIGNNKLGGIFSTFNSNLISQNTFQDNHDFAIKWDVFKDTATITSQNFINNILTLSGQGPDGDTVEVFLSDGQPENALVFVGSAFIDSGIWSLEIPDDGLIFSASRDNYYVTTSTNNTQTSTSELSKPYYVAPNLCNLSSLGIGDTLGKCKGEAILLSLKVDSSSLDQRWFKNGLLVANKLNYYANTGGKYILESTDSYGCTAYDTITVIENPQPLVADFLVSSYTSLDEELVIVDVSYSQPDSVSWDFGEAEVIKEDLYYRLTFPDTGKYDITLTTHLGLCSKTTRKTIHVLESYDNPGSDLTAAFDFKTIQVFPNPTEGKLSTKIVLTKAKDVSVSVYAASGEVYEVSQLSNKQSYDQAFDLSELSPGTYFMKFTTDSDTRILRVMKQ